MTKDQRDSRVAEIHADKTLRAREKARALKSVMWAYETSNFVDNGQGDRVSREVWDGWTSNQRAAFVTAKN